MYFFKKRLKKSGKRKRKERGRKNSAIIFLLIQKIFYQITKTFKKHIDLHLLKFQRNKMNIQ